MERLTNKREADAQREEYKRRLANKYPRNIPEKQFLRLAAYEDTELEPAVCANYKTFEDEAISKGVTFKRIVALMEAYRDERLVMLPCKPDGSMLDTSDPERPEIMKRIHFAVAYMCNKIVFHQPYSIFLENVAASYIRPLNEKAEKALEME
jgi:hypothetical protein